MKRKRGREWYEGWMQGWWLKLRDEGSIERNETNFKPLALQRSAYAQPVSDSISFCLPTFYNDPTKWLNMYIGYCILVTESVFRILRIIHIVRSHFQSFEWASSERECVRACRYMERFSINVSEEYKNPCRIYVLTVTMATCFCHRMFSIPSAIQL